MVRKLLNIGSDQYSCRLKAWKPQTIRLCVDMQSINELGAFSTGMQE